MNTDIAFDKVKMRMIRKTAYHRCQYPDRKLRSLPAQRAFCQMVANATDTDDAGYGVGRLVTGLFKRELHQANLR